MSFRVRAIYNVHKSNTLKPIYKSCIRFEHSLGWIAKRVETVTNKQLWVLFINVEMSSDILWVGMTSSLIGLNIFLM